MRNLVNNRGGDRRTPEQVERARARARLAWMLKSSGFSHAAIGQQLGLSRQRVAVILREYEQEVAS